MSNLENLHKAKCAYLSKMMAIAKNPCCASSLKTQKELKEYEQSLSITWDKLQELKAYPVHNFYETYGGSKQERDYLEKYGFDVIRFLDTQKLNLKY